MNLNARLIQLQTLVREQQIELSRLTEVEGRLNSILDVIAGIHWSKDKKGIYRSCNKAMVEALGLKVKDDIIGKNDYELPWSEQAENLVRNDEEVMLTGQIQEGKEEVVRIADGSLHTFLVTKAPLYNLQGKIVGTVGCSVDITHIKELEQALRAAKEAAEAGNAAKTEFLSNMRHDIRTPLAGIVGFAELLKSELKDPQVQEYADNLVASSHALLELMDEVLEAVRVSSGEIPLLKKKFALRETFEKIIDLYLAKAHQKGIELRLNLDPTLPSYVVGDKIRLHRIVLELVGNALNFTDQGHVILSVDKAKQEETKLILKVTVSDTGIGIPKEKQQEIYIQFKRLTPSYQGIYKGIGLGLYVVRQFIDELSGEIYVESEPHHGSCFTCLIPLQCPLLDDESGIDKEKEAKLEQPYLQPLISPERLTNQKQNNSPNKPRILVVEDNAIAQAAAQSILSAMNCQVDIAVNGQEALTLYAENSYHLIVMDIGLGNGMDGYEVTQAIRSKEKDKSHTPIVALTAHAAEESKERCIRAGMDAVLTKPMTQVCANHLLNAFIIKANKKSSSSLNEKFGLPETTEELFSLNQFALLDVEQTLKRLGDKAIFIELLDNLVNQVLPDDFAEMKNAFAANDYELVEKIAHKIKGGAMYVGTLRMNYACHYLENYFRSGQRDLFSKLYYQAVEVIEKTQNHVKNWLNSSLGKND